MDDDLKYFSELKRRFEEYIKDGKFHRGLALVRNCLKKISKQARFKSRLQLLDLANVGLSSKNLKVRREKILILKDIYEVQAFEEALSF